MAVYDEQSNADWRIHRKEIKNVVIAPGVTSIGNYAFSECENLTSITIPDSVTFIANYAFLACYSLTSLSIPDSVTSIGNFAFCWCTSLASVTMPTSLLYIGEFAFEHCRDLTLLTIPNSVISIGTYAFHDCESLLSVTIPASVTVIGDSVFLLCGDLTFITVDPDNRNYSNDSYGTLFNKEKTVLIQAPSTLSGSYTVPGSVISIQAYAFRECKDLISLTIPGSVTSIGRSVICFYGNLESIYFGGDTRQWSSIAFGPNWNGAKDINVFCTDGTIRY